MTADDFDEIVRGAARVMGLEFEEGESQLDFFVRFVDRLDARAAAFDTVEANPAAPLEVHAMAVGCWRREDETDEALWERMEKRRSEQIF